MNNMNFEEFVLQIQNLLRESDSNLDIQVQTVSKNNGIHYTGLTCRNINTAVSPVIYMEPYFRMFGDGKDIHSIVDTSGPGMVLAGMDGIHYRRNEYQLESGDVLFLYTDGVTEATNINNDRVI